MRIPDVKDSSESHAEVRARGQVVRYRRSGAGPSVVIVAADGRRLPWPELEQLLAERCRVVTPTLDGRDPDALVVQLACFLEGFGASRVTAIVADPAVVPATLRLAAYDPDLIARVAIVYDEPGHASASEGPPDTIVTSPVPVLTLAAREPARDATTRLLRFLGLPVADGAG